MRWPVTIDVTWRWRRTQPGMVWIDDKDLIELQRDALRVCDLEEQIRENKRSTAEGSARTYVTGLLALTADERAAAEAVAADPPLTAAGDLHRVALEATVDAAVWAVRERALSHFDDVQTES